MGLFGRVKKEHWNELLGVLLVIFAIWLLIGLMGYGGGAGNGVRKALTYCIGYVSYFLAAIICYWGVSLFLNAEKGILSGLIGSACLLISGLMFLGVFTAELWRTVGIPGEWLINMCIKGIGSPGLFLTGMVFLILGLTLSSELTFSVLFLGIYRIIRNLFPRSEEAKRKIEKAKKEKVFEKTGQQPDKPLEGPIVVSDEMVNEVEEEVYLRQPGTTSPYVVPSLSLLDRTPPADEDLANEMLEEKAKILGRSFEDFGIKANVLRVNKGPAITRYEVEPGSGVKVSKFVNMTDDLALVLRATRVRVLAPVPGEGVVGIEIPNEKIAQVGLREVLESQTFRNTESKLAMPLGKDISGKSVVADLAGMPHLLIAGTTGSGKSVFVNSVITSMLFRMTPNELRFLMIDPKRVELNAYDGIPHLMAPVVTDVMRAPAYLKWALREVDKRYKKLADVGVRNIEGYNKYLDKHPEVIGKKMNEDNLVHGKLPFIVIIIDELADLMIVAGPEVEASITRLAQIARAAGVHMLVSTQRPSVNVITGLIKANFPCRLSFRVASKVDSRTILDMNGAENLLGRGDMLFLDMNSAKPNRIQGCYVGEDEIERLVDFIKESSPLSESEIGDLDEEESEEDERDELYGEAVEHVLRHRMASTSFLQRRLAVNYDRAMQLLEEMEAEGIIGPDIGDQPREILVDGLDD